MTNKTKAAIEEAADIHLAGYDHKCAYARHQGFMAGMQEVVEHPERYELIAQDKAVQALQPLKERVKEKRVQLARVNQRLSILVGVLKEVDEYLSDNAKNYVGSGSKLHQKIQEVLK